MKEINEAPYPEDRSRARLLVMHFTLQSTAPSRIATGYLRLILTAALGSAPLAMLAAQSPGEGWKKLHQKPIRLAAGVEHQGFFAGYERPIGDGRFEAFGFEITITEKGDFQVSGRTVKATAGSTLIPLGDTKSTAAVRVRVRNRPDDLVWSACSGLAFRLGRETFQLLDCDADGELGEQEEDGLLGPNSWVVSPWNGEVWSEKGGWLVKRGKDGVAWWYREVDLVPERGPSIREAWAYFQCWRQAAGSVSVPWNDEFAAGCEAHCRYYGLNGTYGHFEDPTKPGYSAAGHAAAANSVLGFDKVDALKGIVEQFRTAYHLAAVVCENVISAAMAVGDGCFGGYVNAVDFDRKRPGPVIWAWPPHGATGIQCAFNSSGENPMPLPGRENDYHAAIGQVVLARVAGKGPYSLDVLAGKKKIEGTLSHPDLAVAGIANNRDLVVFAPNKPLPAKCWISATLTMGEGDAQVVHRWRFRTR